MHRSRVHFWRRRFSASGIRGLWDTEGVLPQERIPEAVEQAIVFDCLHRLRMSGDLFEEMMWDPSINWNVRNLARPRGPTVQKYLGIRE